MQLFLPRFSVLQTLVALVSPDIPLFSQLKDSPGSTWVLWPGNSFKEVSWSNCRTHLICFSPLRKHGPSLPDVRILKIIVLYLYVCFVLVFVCFGLVWFWFGLVAIVLGRRVNLDLLFHLGQIRSLLENFSTFYFKKYLNFHKSCETSTMNAYIPFYPDSAIANILPHSCYFSLDR